MKKKYGQNFLINKSIISKIIECAAINNKSIVYEVGPGDGSLTKEIVNKDPIKFICIEIDQSLKKKLDIFFKKKNHELILKNVLNFNELDYFSKNAIIISNLPYNISLKLLIKWIYQYSSSQWYDSMILMFQKEVAERIISKPNSKKFGRITLLVSAYFHVEKVIDVNKNNFFPVPKVDSVVLKFTPLKKLHFTFNNLKKLELLSNIFFSNKRKKLKNKIKKTFSLDIINKYSLDKFFDMRAENLEKELFFTLAKLL